MNSDNTDNHYIMLSLELYHPQHLLQEYKEAIEPYIDWDTLPINSKTIQLFAALQQKKISPSNSRWLESDEWMDICNESDSYDS